MRILLADDESLVRSSLRSMLEELDLPISIIGEAANGEEALAFVAEHEPDLVFIDIRMPKLNGLEAIRAGKTRSPHTRWIILSGYSEFDYAREAIRLGADNYLLKPVSPEELEQSLRKCLKENKKHILFLNSQFENQIIALFHSLHSMKDDTIQTAHSHTTFLCSVFFMDSHAEEHVKVQQLQHVSHMLSQYTHEHIGKDAAIATFTLPTGELCTVGSWKNTKHSEGKHTIQQYFGKLDEIVDRFCNDFVSLTAIQGTECLSFERLQLQVNQILELAELRTVLGIGKKWTLQQFSALKNMSELCDILIKLSVYYKPELYLNYMKTVHDFENVLTTAKLTKQNKQQLCRFLCCALNCQLQSEEDVRNWVTALQNHGNQLLSQNQKHEARPADFVDQAIAFIDQHYMDNIGVGQIAEQLQVTPNYLSTLFHKKTGITFTKYLTKTRILKAKELLLDPNMQVQQVAEAVGYYSTRHFTKLFTESVGCYPSEFRNQFKEETAKKG